jgi:cytochrome P450
MNDLDKFRPERWGEHTPNKLHTVLPFGFGGRICPGKKIAICEMKVFISYILFKYQVSLRNPNEELELDMVLGINIKHNNGNINFIPLDRI